MSQLIREPARIVSFCRAIGIDPAVVSEVELLWDENAPPTNEQRPMVRLRFKGEEMGPLWDGPPPELEAARLDVSAFHRTMTARHASMSAMVQAGMNRTLPEGLKGGVSWTRDVE